MNDIMDENQQVFEAVDVSEIGENEPASKNSQNEATYTSTCDTNNITEITDNMNAITIKEITDKDEIIEILKGQVILLREENDILRENFEVLDKWNLVIEKRNKKLKWK